MTPTIQELDPDDAPLLRPDVPADPHYLLWIAVMEQVLRDLGYGTSHLYYGKAVAWLTNRDRHDVGSFNWVCTLLGLDPDTVYASIKEKYGLA